MKKVNQFFFFCLKFLFYSLLLLIVTWFFFTIICVCGFFIIPRINIVYITKVVLPTLGIVGVIIYLAFLVDNEINSILIKYHLKPYKVNPYTVNPNKKLLKKCMSKLNKTTIKNFFKKIFTYEFYKSLIKKLIAFGTKYLIILNKILRTVLFFVSWIFLLVLLSIVCIFVYVMLDSLGDYLNSLFNNSIIYEILKGVKIAFIKFLFMIPKLFYKLFCLLFTGFVSVPYNFIIDNISFIYNEIHHSISQGDLFLPYKVIKKVFKNFLFP